VWRKCGGNDLKFADTEGRRNAQLWRAIGSEGGGSFGRTN